MSDAPRSMRERLDQAAAALDAGLHAEAATQIASILAHEPASLEARLLEARLNLQLSRPLRTLSSLDALDLYHPHRADAPHTRFLRAQALCLAGEDAIAARVLADLIRDCPDDVRPHRLLAQTHVRLGQPEQAAACLRRVLELEPSDDASRWMLARLVWDEHPEQAIRVLLNASSAAEDRAVRMKLAQLYRQSDRLREADEALATMLADEPEDAALWAVAGQVADAMGADTVARRRLERATTLCGGMWGWINEALAQAHMHAGRLKDACVAWRKAASRERDSLEAWAGLSVCALACDRPDLARRARDRMEGLGDRGARSRAMFRQWSQLSAGRCIAAMREGRMRYEPPTASPLQRLLAHTARTLETHRSQHPRRADTHYHLAMCMDGLGDGEAARTSVRQALAINPRYEAARLLAERLDTLDGPLPMRDAA